MKMFLSVSPGREIHLSFLPFFSPIGAYYSAKQFSINNVFCQVLTRLFDFAKLAMLYGNEHHKAN